MDNKHTTLLFKITTTVGVFTVINDYDTGDTDYVLETLLDDIKATPFICKGWTPDMPPNDEPVDFLFMVQPKDIFYVVCAERAEQNNTEPVEDAKPSVGYSEYPIQTNYLGQSIRIDVMQLNTGNHVYVLPYEINSKPASTAVRHEALDTMMNGYYVMQGHAVGDYTILNAEVALSYDDAKTYLLNYATEQDKGLPGIKKGKAWPGWNDTDNYDDSED